LTLSISLMFYEARRGPREQGVFRRSQRKLETRHYQREQVTPREVSASSNPE
jgi:hypothetical protein